MDRNMQESIFHTSVMGTDHGCVLKVSYQGNKKAKPIVVKFKFGDVWLCNGQSNMMYQMKRTTHFETMKSISPEGG